MNLRAFLLATVFSGTALATPAAYQISIQIVVDLSAPMAAQTGGQPYYRQAMETALKDVEAHGLLPSDVAMSWRTFGGVAANDDSACEATQLLVPAGVTPGPVVRASLPGLIAQGPRPLGAALTGTASDFPHDAQQRAVVLITSGIDTCGEDICLVAADLRRTIGLGPVHVILVNPDPDAASKLQCLGQVTPASDLRSLKKAIDEAIDSTLNPADITVSALDDGTEVPAEVQLFAAGDKQPSIRAPTGAHLQVAAGTYDVRVIKRSQGPDGDQPVSSDPDSEGLLQSVQIFSGSQLALRVPLGGRRANVVATVMFNGQPAPPGTRIAVYHAGDTDVPVASGMPGESISVPPGRYDIRAQIPGGATGNIEVWKPEVSLTPGSTQRVTLAAAQRRGSILVTVTSNGQAVEDASFALVAPGTSGDGAPLYEAGVELPAPAGHYSVVARVETPMGNLQTRHPDVTIAPNGRTTLTIDVGPSAQLTVQVSGRTRDDGIIVGVRRAGEVEFVGDIPTFAPVRLPPGTYDLFIEAPAQAVQRSAADHRVHLMAGDKRTVAIMPVSP